ncbi:MAG: hypothetical protein ACRC33_23585 [Gemmataceae bacterium]
MNVQQIGLSLALEALGRPMNLDDFPSRLTLQKTVYLIQAAGVDLDYRFRWYLHGPYSSGLTRDAFAVASAPPADREAAREWTLDAGGKARLQTLRPLFQEVPDDRLPRHLELLASVHFLLKTHQAREDDPAGTVAVLHRNGKTYFAGPDVNAAAEELRARGLFPVRR